MSDNYICIGDIHGRMDLLEDLLLQISADLIPLSGHKLVFMGDMIDRGPNSFEVVECVKALCDSGRAMALLGNHEDFALDYYRKKIFDKGNIWFYRGNGGTATVLSYLRKYERLGGGFFFDSFERSGHAEWLNSLPLFYETDKVWFSHAPIPRQEIMRAMHQPFDGDFRANKDVLLWTYYDDSVEDVWERDHGKLAVCGHVHALSSGLLEPRIFPHLIYSDTGSGCAPEGRLTGIVITDGKYERYLQAIPK